MNMAYNFTYFIKTLGCKVNQYDSASIGKLLSQGGYIQAECEKDADIIIINTCTVTNMADKKSRSAIKRARSINPSAKIVMCGCMAELEGAKFLNEKLIELYIPNNKKNNILNILNNTLIYNNNTKHQVLNNQTIITSLPYKNTRTRSLLKIQEGCNNSCSYCIIPVVRGVSISKSYNEIISEVKDYINKGIHEIVLTGIHICSYSYNGFDLLDIIKSITNLNKSVRLRLGSLDPRFINAEWFKTASKINSLCPHFHISLQSGSDKILNQMNRGYSCSYFKSLINIIRDLWQNPSITTDIITGFPGEGEKEFLETEKYVLDIKFSRIHVFPYSERKGTKAALMKDKVPIYERKERAAHLIKCAKVLEFNYIDNSLGMEDNVIFEKCNGQYAFGHTSRYLKVKAQGGLMGKLNRVRLIKRQGDEVECEILN